MAVSTEARPRLKVYAARDPASVRLPGVLPIRLDVTRADDVAAIAPNAATPRC